MLLSIVLEFLAMSEIHEKEIRGMNIRIALFANADFLLGIENSLKN